MSPILLNLGGLPGGLIAMKSSTERRRDGIWYLGLMVAIVGQCFVAFAWASLIITFVRNSSAQSGFWGWILWIIGFFAAVSLTAAGSRATLVEERTDVEYGEKAKFNVQHIAVPIAGIAEVIGFFVFVFVPSLMSLLYGWLPYIE